jgi:hypothetical protein
VLRWALHEAAMGAARPTSPDHAHYLQVRTRLGGKRAALSVARKLARKAYHTCAPSATRRWRRLRSNPPPDPPSTRRARAPSLC